MKSLLGGRDGKQRQLKSLCWTIQQQGGEADHFTFHS